MEQITYREIEKEEITRRLFDGFERYQKVTRCWRKVDGEWILKDIAFIDDWGEKEYEFLVECLRRTVDTGGAVLGAFCDERLIGFASVEGRRLGSRGQYMQLSSLHVSCRVRGRGTGKALFARACAFARGKGAEKLYISAHSAEETQAFYHAVGCVEAEEYDAALAAAEPCDCQMEFVL